MKTNRLSKSHQTIERGLVAGEVYTLLSSDTEGMCLQSQTGYTDIIRDNITSDCTSAVCDLESLLGIHETGRGLSTEEDVVSLRNSEFKNRFRVEAINSYVDITHAVPSARRHARLGTDPQV